MMFAHVCTVDWLWFGHKHAYAILCTFVEVVHVKFMAMGSEDVRERNMAKWIQLICGAHVIGILQNEIWKKKPATWVKAWGTPTDEYIGILNTYCWQPGLGVDKQMCSPAFSCSAGMSLFRLVWNNFTKLVCFGAEQKLRRKESHLAL